MPGASLHRGVQLHGPECVLAPVAASAAQKIEIIWCYLTDTSLWSCLGAQNNISDLNVDRPSCTSLNKMHLAINRGGCLMHLSYLPS